MMKQLLSIITVWCFFIGAANSFVYNPQMAQTLTKYAFLTYCQVNNIQSWTCGEACNVVEKLQNISVIVSGSDNLVVMGYRQSDNAIVISIRGTLTTSFSNIVQDLSVIRTPYNYLKCPNCWVHIGFQGAFQSLYPEISLKFLTLRAQYKTAKVYLTGHSLGAAIATLLAPFLYELNGNKKIDVFYIVGSPRVGDGAFSVYFAANNNFAIESARISLGHDPVVQNPTNWWPVSYQHIGNEIYYKNAADIYTYLSCNLPESSFCGNSYYLPIDISDHSKYMAINSAAYKSC